MEATFYEDSSDPNVCRRIAIGPSGDDRPILISAREYGDGEEEAWVGVSMSLDDAELLGRTVLLIVEHMRAVQGARP